jgi:hypothetical protein
MTDRQDATSRVIPTALAWFKMALIASSGQPSALKMRGGRAPEIMHCERLALLRVEPGRFSRRARRGDLPVLGARGVRTGVKPRASQGQPVPRAL